MLSTRQSRQLRVGRYSESGRIYLITSNTRDRQPIFGDLRIGRLVARQFMEAERDDLVQSLAWVVMPDHFHWLLELKSGSLSQAVGRTKSLTCAAVNAAQGRTGSIWQQGFHDRAVRRDEDLKALARYVVMNPVRAGLVKRIGNYPLWDAVWI
ncbi:transposase [Pseudomonas quasicaspiana]|nr:transposase [Pseudomonas quasicaspiana]